MPDINERIARVEAMLDAAERANNRELQVSGDIHSRLAANDERIAALVGVLSNRVDAVGVTIAKGIGALAVIVILVNLIAPVLINYITTGRP